MLETARCLVINIGGAGGESPLRSSWSYTGEWGSYGCSKGVIIVTCLTVVKLMFDLRSYKSIMFWKICLLLPRHFRIC